MHCKGLVIVSQCVYQYYLDSKGAEYNCAENGISEYAVEHIALSVDLTGIDFIEELHQNECVEDDGVMFRWRGVQGGIPSTVDIKDSFSCKHKVC